MDIDKTNNENLNRRRAFRIIEPVDLFYHPIDLNHEDQATIDINSVIAQAVIESHSPATTEQHIDPNFPKSKTEDNDALNVNISSSGISFTCKEKLKAYDYLIIRVLLLSSMTVITSCCKVVYSKPSNPFEKNQYPYLIGAQFVNLKTEDKELLDRHINKKRTRKFIVNSLLAILIVSILIMPDLALEYFIGFCSFLFDELIEMAHLSYEFIEYGLDLFIEHTFHTGMQETQIIVFYIQIALALVLSYPVIRGAISIIKNLYSSFCCFFSRKKSSLLYVWGEQSFWYQVGLISTGIFVISSYLLFFI